MTGLRKIIHIDCDCFFAAVEIRDNPALKGLPIAVGGKAGSRGVLSTCSYEARRFGLHSAMPTSEALRRCPQLILLPHRMAAYKEASVNMHTIFSRYTTLIEPLSLDEAFLDVTESKLHRGSASLLSKQIRAEIETEVGITASAGIASNKFLAKVASDWNKPNGQFVITPDKVAAFMQDLPVERIPGVGKKSMIKMSALNIHVCADLQQVEESILHENFGVFGQRLKSLSFGLDDRPVSVSRLRKSLSVEHTFAKNIDEERHCGVPLKDLYQQLLRRLAVFHKKAAQDKSLQQVQVKSLQLKLKFFDFTATTIECQGTEANFETFQQLLHKAWLRTGKSIRLIGLGVGFSYNSHQSSQLQLNFEL
ncbi:MAG: DNA polymerase IV [Pseudomonadales bacterium]|nr:DNA polymerase IV [Pseudomonadales bacterium]